MRGSCFYSRHASQLRYDGAFREGAEREPLLAASVTGSALALFGWNALDALHMARNLIVTVRQVNAFAGRWTFGNGETWTPFRCRPDRP